MEPLTKEDFICQYCHKKYSNKYVLINHQKTTKSCLQAQEEMNKIIIKCDYCNKTFLTQSNLNTHKKTSKTCHQLNNAKELVTFICTCCNKNFTSKAYLDKHFSQCSVIKKNLEEKYNVQVNNLQDEIKKINKQLENGRLENNTLSTKLKEVEKQLNKQEQLNKHLQDRLIEKATSKTNNTTNNNIDLKLFISEEAVNQKIQNKFTKNHLVGGYNSIANFIKSEIATNDEGKLLYTCSDPSRQIFNYTDEKGNEIKDVKGTKMISLVKPKLIEKTSQIQVKEQDEYNYLRKRYNGEDEVADEDVQKRMDLHKFYSDLATDMITNKIYDEKFPTKMSSELVKVLS